MATFASALKSKLIYVFAINDERHKDCLKIGETTIDEDDGSNLFNNSEALQKAAHKRIKQYTQTTGISYQLLYTEISIFSRNGLIMTFNDKQVHKVLERSGVKQKEFDDVSGAEEWYCCDLETVKKAINAVKNGVSSLHPSEITKDRKSIDFRPEQLKAIKDTRARFKKGNQMLWYAKMRFGKTLSALQVIKEENFTRTLILTHRPVVDDGWYKDYKKIFYDRNDFNYGSKTNGGEFEELESGVAKGSKYIYFASMQDLRGSEKVGGKFDKNDEVFSVNWDLVIIDEAHEGTKTDLGKNVIKELTKPTTKVLQLSGTPFNLFDDYNESEIFTWDYVMEQKAKQAWITDNPYKPNPYASLPAINIYTYDLGNLMYDYIEDEKAFNFREFFRTKEDGTFVHDKDVDRFLDLLCKDDKDSLYPYSNDEFRRIFRHTLWVLPGVKAAKALSAKLKYHDVFGKFKTINVAGDGDDDEENEKALQMVNKAIGPDPDETFTITLTCTRLTTGVSIEPWTAVFMMAGSFSTSAPQYMQTIFRVQTPYENHGRMKENCYAFDFAPDRTLRVLAETAKVSAKAGKQSEEDRRILGDFLNFCPIISIEGSKMTPYDVNKMMGQLKKAQIEKVVQCGFEDGGLYNDELYKLTDIDLRDFDYLKKKIGTTKAMAKSSDIDINNQGYTKEEYEELERIGKKKKADLTEAEKKLLEERNEKKKNRDAAISILRGISIRMPLLLYGAELKNEDEEISLDNFASLIDDQSWEEFMPKKVTKEDFERFKKYYDPDVFREAGKRIREMARAADKFSIEERIERIATIFNTFRNPDKETVLTPWRVVNMHMSDCLGGWCFWDNDFKQMLSIPRYVDQGQVTKDVFRTDSHILEINSKSGLYPLYVAYNIYRCRVEEAKKKYGEVGLGFSKSLWDATVEENILVICKTPMAKSITKRTLAGFRDVKVNAQHYSRLLEIITERPELVVNIIRDGKHFWKIKNNQNMKLDAIVGNPPYQVMDGGAGVSAIPVYNRFVDLAKKTNPHYISMIMPAKWYNAGRGLEQFRSDMLNDKSISKLYDYVDPHDCFPTVDVAGGVCYFLRDNNYNGLCNFVSCKAGSKIANMRDLSESEVLIRHQEEISILNKVQVKGQTYLNAIAYSQKPFGLRTYVKPLAEGDILLRYNGGIGPYSRDLITVNNNLIDRWKIVTSRLTAEHAGETDRNGQKRIFSILEILEPGTICTETYMMLYACESQAECANMLHYLKTRFVRALIAMATSTQQMSKANFRFVPLQDFSKPWTDAELYAKYGLTDDEIAFIESMIKPME